MVHQNVKMSKGFENAFRVMGNLVWKLNNEAVVLSRLLKEEYPLHRNVHAKAQREKKEGDVLQEGKVDYRGQNTAWQCVWGVEHPSSEDPQKV